MATEKKPAKESKKSAKAPANETKADKFKRIAPMRVTKAIKAVSLIGNLGGSGYERTPEQVEKIGAALKEAVNEACQKLLSGNKAANKAFEL